MVRMALRSAGGEGRVILVLLALLLPVLACGDAEPANGAGSEMPPRVQPPEATAPDPGVSGRPPVRVWLNRGDSVVAAPRAGAEPTLRSALESLVAGPTTEERSLGLSSWFGEETRGVLRAVRIDSGRAVVDFRPSLPTLIPGAGSSAGSRILLAALDSTVFQFPSVESVEYQLEGSCDAFWEWLQRECVVVRR